jgi:hypothetical protein
MSIRLDHGDGDLDVVHEINVTPFIDVILVLLIIFMIAAPLATVDVGVDLPTSNAERQPRPDAGAGRHAGCARWRAGGARRCFKRRPKSARLCACRQGGCVW